MGNECGSNLAFLLLFTNNIYVNTKISGDLILHILMCNLSGCSILFSSFLSSHQNVYHSRQNIEKILPDKYAYSCPCILISSLKYVIVAGGQLGSLRISFP